MLPRELSEPMEPNATMRMIEDLDEKYGNAIPIFGGALWVNDLEALVASLPHIIHSAKFFGWHDTLAGACRTFCSLCFTDYMLVEAFIGMRFEELCKGEN